MSQRPRPYHALRYRDFRWLWIAQLVSLTGTQMQAVAINWHVYLLTRSALALGFIGLTRVVPIIGFSLWGGIVADRRDRRLIMAAAQSIMVVASVALAGITFSHSDTLWWLYAINALAAAAAAFDGPARQALIPRLVPTANLSGALSLNLTAFHAALIGGPALAGLLIASASAGAATPAAVHSITAIAASRSALALIYALNAVSFLGVIVTLWVMKTSGKVQSGGAHSGSPLASLRGGLRFVFTTPVMVWTMTLDFFATFFSGAMSLLPIVADQVLHVGPAGYGWLAAAPAIGALTGSLYTSIHPLPERQGRLLLWSVAAYAVATVAYGLSRSYLFTFVALAGTGVSDLVSTVIRQTIRQLITPDDLRGRMTSVNMIFYMGGPQLGEMEAGLIASLFASAALGVTVSIVSGGLATLAVTGLVALWTPIVRDHVSPYERSRQ